MKKCEVCSQQMNTFTKSLRCQVPGLKMCRDCYNSPENEKWLLDEAARIMKGIHVSDLEAYINREEEFNRKVRTRMTQKNLWKFL